MEEDNFYKKTILVVDDEKTIRTLLNVNLTKEGYNVIEAVDGAEAIDIALEQKPDLILLDVMLPKVDGLSVCKKIKNTMNIPILMVSAKDGDVDKILGLELGADDYITKPFNIREVIARIKANLRKVEASSKAVDAQDRPAKSENIIKVGALTLDLDRFEVMVNDKVVDLTLREFVTGRRKREKIEKDTSNPKILMTKRSVGYYIAS